MNIIAMTVVFMLACTAAVTFMFDEYYTRALNSCIKPRIRWCYTTWKCYGDADNTAANIYDPTVLYKLVLSNSKDCSSLSAADAAADPTCNCIDPGLTDRANGVPTGTNYQPAVPSSGSNAGFSTYTLGAGGQPIDSATGASQPYPANLRFCQSTNTGNSGLAVASTGEANTTPSPNANNTVPK